MSGRKSGKKEWKKKGGATELDPEGKLTLTAGEGKMGPTEGKRVERLVCPGTCADRVGLRSMLWTQRVIARDSIPSLPRTATV